MRIDGGTPESASLPGIPIPGNPHKEQRRIFIEWASEDDKKSLNGNCGFKWLKDNEIVISCDDEAISKHELKYYLDYGVGALGRGRDHWMIASSGIISINILAALMK